MAHSDSQVSSYFLFCAGDIVFAVLPKKPEDGSMIVINEQTNQVIWRGSKLEIGKYRVEKVEDMQGDFATHPTLNKLYTIYRFGG